MSVYHPDRWVIVGLSDGKTNYNKVFSGNYGGYAGSDTWKLSSSIEKITEDAEGFEILCSSGSTYICHKNAHGMSGYMTAIFSGWVHESKEITIKVLDGYDK